MDDARLKHLEFIQQVISRQAGNQFLIKGWSLTVAIALAALNLKAMDWRVALVGLLPPAAFGWLDAYFLRQERLFRCLYNAAIATNSAVPLLSMDTRPHKDEHSSWKSVLKSTPLQVLYTGSFLLAIGVVLAAAVHHAPAASR